MFLGVTVREYVCSFCLSASSYSFVSVQFREGLKIDLRTGNFMWVLDNVDVKVEWKYKSPSQTTILFFLPAKIVIDSKLWSTSKFFKSICRGIKPWFFANYVQLAFWQGHSLIEKKILSSQAYICRKNYTTSIYM